MRILPGPAILGSIVKTGPALYFAYGSNLASRRMRERAPGARPRGPARLEGWRLTTDKPGRDGTAKANIVRDPGSSVWGVLWEMEAEELARLDRHEGGYARVEVVVAAAGATPVAAQTYASRLSAADAALARGYRALVLEGAREHGLPAEWVAFLEALPER
jgi:hypothetical protein